MIGKRSNHVVVIGGGVIGAMCAWNLSQAGCQVTIVDRDRFGAACSHGNCGYVCPSHVLPLARPGAISSTLRAMMSRHSPFAIRPRLSRQFVSWFWNFARSCNRKDMLAAADGRHELLQSSMRLYNELIEEHSIECEWQKRGLLFVHDTPAEFESYRQTDELLRATFGVTATPYAGDSVLEIEPALKSGIGGAWHYEDDCHLRPDKLMSALREKLTERGVQFVEHVSIEHFVRDSAGTGIARAVVGNGNASIEGDRFVVATGAMTPFLNRHLGCRIPIEPGKGYSLTMPTPARMPKIPIIFESSHVAITPMQSKYRIGSTMEFVGYDSSINRDRINLLRTAAEKYLHVPHCEPVEEEWFGWRPMVWDGKPIIDRSPAMNNVWIAAGHSMLGLSMATGTGRLIQELILGEEPHIDTSPFRVSRFR